MTWQEYAWATDEEQRLADADALKEMDRICAQLKSLAQTHPGASLFGDILEDALSTAFLRGMKAEKDRKLDELLPCAHCGAQAEWINGCDDTGRCPYTIGCPNNGCSISGNSYERPELAVEKWNRRVSPPPSDTSDVEAWVNEKAACRSFRLQYCPWIDHKWSIELCESAGAYTNVAGRGIGDTKAQAVTSAMRVVRR